MKKILNRLCFAAIALAGLAWFFSFLWAPLWVLTGVTGFSAIGKKLDVMEVTSDVDL